ncbi:unnamed protein product [Dovyalis caffra]|uniref:Heparan-alpha-glucosaminide N-acetyltransferase n=1 Tax=Dovyalis caffra TaxID=77055 RepID=A0AAV1SDB8_9ROSI|nr:unnamed protein product [Dovyalis caffra]
MSTLIAVTTELDEREREPLLHNPCSLSNEEDTAAPSTSSSDAPPQPTQRLLSLDVFRGLTVAKVSSKPTAAKKVILRTIKLFLLGLLLQGGYFHGRHDLSYGVDVSKIRWMGVLQRISIGYLFAAMSEIWLVDGIAVDSSMAFVKKYYIQWMVAFFFCTFYMCLLYGLYVPDWEFEVPNTDLFGYKLDTKIVNCGVKGSLEPPCNAVGLIDRFILGEHHLYQRPVYRRTKQCSVNSPDYGTLPPNSPGWCLAPFDPEGILSSLMAAITCFLGLQFGHILVHFKVDVKHVRKPTMILQWMGMNALIIYALAACDLFPAAIQGFYWGSPENNLVDGTEWLFQAMFHSKKWGTLVFVIVEILFWSLVAGFLHLKGIYQRINVATKVTGVHMALAPRHLTKGKKKSMATEKANVEVSDTNNDNHQNTSTQTSVNSETPSSAVPRFGKALAHRALYGSGSRHGGSRKARTNDAKTSPSRLSKVSLADHRENRE